MFIAWRGLRKDRACIRKKSWKCRAIYESRSNRKVSPTVNTAENNTILQLPCPHKYLWLKGCRSISSDRIIQIIRCATYTYSTDYILTAHDWSRAGDRCNAR